MPITVLDISSGIRLEERLFQQYTNSEGNYVFNLSTIGTMLKMKLCRIDWRREDAWKTVTYSVLLLTMHLNMLGIAMERLNGDTVKNINTHNVNVLDVVSESDPSVHVHLLNGDALSVITNTSFTSLH